MPTSPGWTLVISPLLGAALGVVDPYPGPGPRPDPVPCPQDEAASVEDSGWSGSWATSFGPLQLRPEVSQAVRQEAEGFAGHYTIEGNPGELHGKVEDGRLIVRYYGPGTDGDAWFEMHDDGTRFEGRWSPNEAEWWLPWNGYRSSALQHLPTLRSGEPLEGIIEESDPEVTSNTLLNYALDTAVRGKLYLVEPPPHDPWFIELRAEAFNSYLVLRDIDGNVLAEDNGIETVSHARIAIPAPRAQSFLLHVCSIDG